MLSTLQKAFGEWLFPKPPEPEPPAEKTFPQFDLRLEKYLPAGFRFRRRYSLGYAVDLLDEEVFTYDFVGFGGGVQWSEWVDEGLRGRITKYFEAARVKLDAELEQEAMEKARQAKISSQNRCKYLDGLSE